jgi:hypothetical protein
MVPETDRSRGKCLMVPETDRGGGLCLAVVCLNEFAVPRTSFIRESTLTSMRHTSRTVSLAHGIRLSGSVGTGRLLLHPHHLVGTAVARYHDSGRVCVRHTQHRTQ